MGGEDATPLAKIDSGALHGGRKSPIKRSPADVRFLFQSRPDHLRQDVGRHRNRVVGRDTQRHAGEGQRAPPVQYLPSLGRKPPGQCPSKTS